MSFVSAVFVVSSMIIGQQQNDWLGADGGKRASSDLHREEPMNTSRVCPQTIQSFLSAIYQQKPPDYYLCVGAPALRQWHFFRHPEAAARMVVAYNERSPVNTYCSTVAYQRRPNSGRGKEVDCGAVLAAHADIDVRGEAHNGKKYPLSKESAILIANSIGLKPSIVVDSGYGIQPWWLLESPIITTTPQERDEAKILIGMVWATVATMAAALGYEIDITADLARVLRVAGTVNVKDETHPRPATIISMDPDAQYSPDDFRNLGVREDILRSVIWRVKSRERRQPLNADGVDFASIGLPSEELLGVWLDNIPEFERIWNGQPLSGMNDTSPSGFTWWLMRQCALAGAPIEMAYSLCLGWRTKHGANPEKMSRVHTFLDEYEKASRGVPR